MNIYLLLDDLKKKCQSKDVLDNNYLFGTYRMLLENPKLVKMRKRQSIFFNDFNPEVKCTIESLLSTPCESGDYIPITLVEQIQSEMLEVFNKFYQEEPFSESNQSEMRMKNNQLIIQNYMSTHSCINNIYFIIIVSFNYQKKILPWNSWNSPYDIDENDSRNSYNNRFRQDIIVVASLIDKLPNLGGLARTCEIFGAKKLVLGNMKVINDPMFQQV